MISFTFQLIDSLLFGNQFAELCNLLDQTKLQHQQNLKKISQQGSHLELGELRLIISTFINEPTFELDIMLLYISHNLMRKSNNHSVVEQNRQNDSSRLSVGSNSSVGRKRISRKKNGQQKLQSSKSKGKQSIRKNQFQSFYADYMRRSSFGKQQQLPPNPTLRKSQTTKEASPPFRTLKQSVKGSRASPEEKVAIKRQPTPVKSRKQIHKSPEKTNQFSFQDSLYLSELQNKLELERSDRLKIKVICEKQNEEVKRLKEMISFYEKQNEAIRNQNSESTTKIQQLEKLILQGQSNLNAAQGALNKLRKVIKQNRINELTTEVKELNKKLELLTAENEDIKKENVELIQDLGKNIKEVEELRKKLDLISKYRTESMRENFLESQLRKLKEHMQCSKTEREIFLESEVNKKDQLIFGQKSEIKCLQIKMHYLEHAKNKEIREIIEKKDAEIKMVRVRSSQLIQKAKNDSEKLSRREPPNTHLESSPSPKRRKGSEVLLELSPEG